MENEVQHPNKDPLGLVGKYIGYANDIQHKFKVVAFSHPAVHTVRTKAEGEDVEVIGETYRYSVEVNFLNVGRKVVTCVVRNVDITSSQHMNDILRKKVISFLEHNAETLVAEHGIENRIPWDVEDKKDN